MADVEMQKEIEDISSKYQLMTCIRNVFRIPTIVDRINNMGLPLDFSIDFICQMALHRRVNFTTMFAVLYPYFEDMGEEGYQHTADMIAGCMVAGLADFDPITNDLVCALPIPEEVQSKLDSFQYPMPMVIPPRQVKSNRQSGYLTTRKSVLLKGYNHHDYDVCLDHINRANSVAYTLNLNVARMVENAWKDLDKQKPDELREDYIDRLASFLRYDHNSREVMELMNMAGNKFYLTNRYDKRGRTYAQGYHITTQGNSWNKAVVEFADKELI